MKRLSTPLKEADVKELRTGDVVSLSGVVMTARDMAHRYLAEEKPESFRKKLKGGAIYHCGPVVKKKGRSYSIVSAGPTTSMRQEPYEWIVIRDYGVRAVIGKGGMGTQTLDACRAYGCVYMQATGGAGAMIADKIKKVLRVHKLEEFGVPEALWELEVDGLECVVTMDSRGKSLHEDVLDESEKNLKKVL